MIRRTVPVFALVLFFLSTQAAHTQASAPRTSGLLKGKIQLVNSEPVPPMIRIKLRSLFKGTLLTTEADSSGNFLFSDLPNGPYDLVVKLDGYQPFQSSVAIGETCTSCIVDVLLRPMSDETRPEKTKSKLVSARELGNKISSKAIKAYEKALEQKRKGNDQEALKLLDKAVTLSPAYTQAYREIGKLHIKHQKVEAARDAFEKAITLGSTDADAHTQLGIIYYNRHQNSQAIQILQKAIAYDPQSALSFLYLGGACYQDGRYAEAIEHLRKALTLDPQKSSQAHLQLANIHIKQKRYREAIEEMTAYLNKNPDASEAPEVRKNLQILEDAMETVGTER